MPITKPERHEATFMTTTTTNSYMVTNRTDPTSGTQSPLSGSALWWYLSPNPKDQNPDNFVNQSTSPSSTPPATFSDAITAQLQAMSRPSLTVFVHGLDCLWVPSAVTKTNAVMYTGLLGQNLANAGYGGLVIGFSWPSNGPLDALQYADGYPPTVPASGWDARGNILRSVDSFAALFRWIAQLAAGFSQSGSSLEVNLVCHSEGNFMLMCAATAGALSAGAINQVVMLAADINDAAFQVPATGLTGQAAAIATCAQLVTIYSSTNDPILADSIEYYTKFHNPSYPGRLGLSGPSYPANQQSNAVGVDCSAVVNGTYVDQLPTSIWPPNTSLHVAYFYIPQVLQDITQTLLGTAPADVSNRSANPPANPPVGSYTMNPLPG